MRKTIALFAFVMILSTLILAFSACGECEHQWDEGYIAEEPTDKSAGHKIYTCTLCGETKSEEITKLTHTKHEFTKTKWGYDEKNHWLICDFEDCGATTVKGVHLYSRSITGELICLVCKSTSNSHSFTDKREFDENFHWIACDEKDCPTKLSRLPHSLDNAGKCTECGFVSVHEAHTYTKWDITKDTHRLICTFEGCSSTTEKAVHVWIEENGTTICRDCRTSKK